MTDMRVKMILDLVNRIRPGAREAERDLKGVKDAAKGLDNASGTRRLFNGLLDLVVPSRRAARAIREAKLAADELGRSNGPARLSRNLSKARADMRQLSRDASARNPGSVAAGLTPGVRGALGGYLGARTAADSIKRHAEAERAVTRIGITADASNEALAEVGQTAFKIAQDVAMPYDKVVAGLDVLVAQGRTLKDAMAFLPSVAKTASAAGAEVEDIAKTADSVSSNFKIASAEMQRAFDIMAAGGKAGQFELKDMARYLPSLGPAAAAAGFKGEQGLRDLVAMLQVMRKGTGTSEEAVASLNNVFQKMESDETAKRFKKFGVDVESAMAKGRKEGRNLVEVFEELTSTALQGDLSKIPKLFQDQEFARGVRAMMTYRGEWQKLSRTIGTTAAGSVEADLDKVTENVQARLDRLANTYGKRMRQIGAVISDVLVPIDNKVEEITSGKNATANKIEEFARYRNADIVAREELRTGDERNYDAEFRRIVDARKQFLEREAFDGAVAKLDQDIATKQKAVDWSRQRRHAAPETEKQLAQLKAERAELIAVKEARDAANIALGETEAARRRLDTRLSGKADEKPGPITPGLTSFGVGPNGVSPNRPTQPFEVPDAVPSPPQRPADLPKPVPVLKSIDDIYEGATRDRLQSLKALASRPMPNDDSEAGTRLKTLRDTYGPLAGKPAHDVGPGLLSFGLKGATAMKASAEWAERIRSDMDIDLGPAGMTMAEKLAAGLAAGQGTVSGAAHGLEGAVKDALSGGDFAAEGQRQAHSFAQGLRAGGPAVTAAAEALASRAKAAFDKANPASLSSVARPRRISGALHDGVE